MTPRWPRYAAAALGFVWFLQVCGIAALNPMHTDWMFTGDWRQHWLGFLFFEREPWSFPLGTLASLHYPVGTNIGFTDSNPLLAILLKPFSGLFPSEYQLIGLWLASCFALQGYLGAALASTVTKDPAQQVLGGYWFVLSPVLVARVGHDTLCAQWILLGLLYLGLREFADRSESTRAPYFVTGAVLTAGAIHPYLAAMAWGLAQAVFLRLWRAGVVRRWQTPIWMAGSTAGLIAVWWVIGYLGRQGSDLSGGFGDYPADLLALFLPLDNSRLVPNPSTNPAAWEGFAFLGAGGILALVAGLVVLARRRPTPRPGIIFVLAACVLLAIYALSSSVRWAGEEVASLESFYAPIMSLVKPFRSSGRFIWALHYLVLLFGLWGMTRLFGRDRIAAGTLMLAIAVAVQAGDEANGRWWVKRRTDKDVPLATFDLARGHYRHLALAPAQVLGACGTRYQEDYVYQFMMLAYRLNLTFNSGIYARVDLKASQDACMAQNRAVDSGALDLETIYVPLAQEVERFKVQADAACGKWDGHWYCVSRKSNSRFATYIETGKDPGASK